MITTRKADREVHSPDAIAGALSRIVFGIRFRRQGDCKLNSIKTLTTSLFDAKDGDALNSYIIIADRGYGKDAFLELMASLGFSCMFIIPGRVIWAHPFAAASTLNPHRDEDDMEDGAVCSEKSNSVGGVKAVEISCFLIIPEQGQIIVLDRSNAFVVRDSAQLGSTVFCSSKLHRFPSTGQRRVTFLLQGNTGPQYFGSFFVSCMLSPPPPSAIIYKSWFLLQQSASIHHAHSLPESMTV